jgi:hypothetical protein
MSEIHLNDIWHRLGVTEAQNRELLRMVSDLKETHAQHSQKHEARISRIEGAINFVKYGSVAVAAVFTAAFNIVSEFFRHLK